MILKEFYDVLTFLTFEAFIIGISYSSYDKLQQ